MKYIVWISTTMYYLCDDKDQVDEKLRLLAEDISIPSTTVIHILEVGHTISVEDLRELLPTKGDLMVATVNALELGDEPMIARPNGPIISTHPYVKDKS